jgi:hypothetical protein
VQLIEKLVLDQAIEPSQESASNKESGHEFCLRPVVLTHSCLFFAVLDIKPRASQMLGYCSNTELHPGPGRAF